MNSRIGFAILACCALAACGGGGGGTGLPNVTPPGSNPQGSPPPKSSPSPTPTVSPAGSPTPSPTGSLTSAPSPVSVQFTANLPLNESGNYLGYPLVFGVRLFSNNGTPKNIVTTQQTSCRSQSCRFTLGMPAGTDAFSLTYAYGSQGAAGNGLTPLSYRSAQTAIISSGSPNTIGVSLLGVPAYYELDASGNSPWSRTMPLSLRAVDDSNTCTPQQQINDCAVSAFITGTYAAPITLVDTDTSGQTALVLNSGAPASSVTVTKSSDGVALRIAAGANVSQGYVTPSGSFDSSEFGSAYQSPITLTPWATQDPNGLGFTCTNGSCQTTGPSSVTIQSHRLHP